MDATELKNLADTLARSAVSGDRAPLQKIAFDMGALKEQVSGALANPMLRNSLIGAGVGGLTGLLTGDEDDRGSKALHYALLGGMGGAGLTAGMSALNKATAPAPKELRAPVTSNIKPLAKAVGVGAGAAAGAAAAGLGARAMRAGHAGLLRSLPRNSVARQSIRSFGRLPAAGRYGAPIAGAALLYSLLNGSQLSK
jgi:hypothetical protein